MRKAIIIFESSKTWPEILFLDLSVGCEPVLK
jgi:hypothetical protein